MDNQLNIVDVSDLAGLRREPCSRVACGPGAERPTEGGGTPGFLAILLQGLEEETPPSSPVPQEEGSGSDHVPSDVNEQLASEQPAAEPVVADETQGDRSPSSASEQVPAEPASSDRDPSTQELEAPEQVREHHEVRARDGFGPFARSRPALAPEPGQPAEPQVRTPQHTVTPENAEPAETHVRLSQETAMVTDKAPETTETAGLTRAPEFVVEPPASDESFATEEPSPKETDAGSEPKQLVEPMTAPADGRPLVLNAADGGNGSGAGTEAKPNVLDSAAEQLRENSEQVPPEPREPRANSGHVPETPRDATHESPNAAGREAVVASGEPEQPLLNALGARQPATAPTMVAGPDAVSSIESSLGADTFGGENQQTDLGASARGSTGSQTDSAPDADVVDQLDSVFKQVLSTARLPVDLRQRIELARSIGRQVVRNAAVSVRNGQTHVLLQLRPPSLGTVRMHLTTENQTVSARMIVENEVVRQAVEQHVEQLRSVLRQEGFNLDRFEVSVRTQAEADAWASAHAEGNGRHAGRAGGGDDGDAADEVRAEQSPEIGAVWASTHDGIVDYVA